MNIVFVGILVALNFYLVVTIISQSHIYFGFSVTYLFRIFKVIIFVLVLGSVAGQVTPLFFTTFDTVFVISFCHVFQQFTLFIFYVSPQILYLPKIAQI